MTLVRWKRFTWDLQKASPRGAAALPSFQVREAVLEDERATTDVISNALALEFGWGGASKVHRMTLDSQLAAAFDLPNVPVIVVRHGQRIIAASLLSADPEADNHLLSGPCVLSEYRNRGIGSALLSESLHFLREAGLERAHGVCRESSVLEKFVYRKFASSAHSYDFEAAALAHR